MDKQLYENLKQLYTNEISDDASVRAIIDELRNKVEECDNFELHYSAVEACGDGTLTIFLFKKQSKKSFARYVISPSDFILEKK